MNRIEIHLRGVALLAVLGGSVLMTGCTGSVSRLTEERDVALRALHSTVAELERTRGELEALQQSKAGVGGELVRAREESTSLRERNELLEAKNRELESAIEANRADYGKLKETHSRLNQMAQVNLDQIASLRQLNENLLREKVQLEQDNTAHDRTITRLTREVDDLKTELIRQATDAQVAKGLPPVKPPPVAQARPEYEIPAGVDPLDAVSKLPLAVHAQIVLSRIWDDLTERFDRALAGEIVWDSIDIALLSTFGCLVLFALAALAYFYRVRRLRRQLRQYRAYLSSKQKTGRASSGTRYVVGGEPSEGVGFEGEEDFDDEYAEDEAQFAAESRRSRPRPEAFSPIFRSDPGEEVEEAVPPVSRAEAQQVQQAQQRQRRVIGAVTERREKTTESPRGDYKELPAATQIIMPVRPNSGDGDDSGGGAIEEIAVTEIMDRSAFERASSGHGGSDEQELLDELKLIINKKLDSDD